MESGLFEVPKEDIIIRNIVLDRNRKKLFVEKKEIHLTRNEYLYLEKLMANADIVVSRDSLLGYTWNTTAKNINTRIVDVYIGYLRKKLPKDTIQISRGFGYVIYK